MYGVFSHSESFDFEKCERVLESFPEKVSPTPFVMFLKAVKSKEIFFRCLYKV